MKKILGTVCAVLFFVLALAKSAPAMDRVQWLFGLNPPSSWANYAQRYTRIGFGQFIWDALGTTNSYYHNCTVQVSSGLNVVVGPAGANTNCSLYQYLAEEATSFGGPGGTALAADPNQVFLQGLIYGGATTAAIGPLTAGTSGGQSVNNLLECKVLIQDATSQTGTFISALGVVTTSAVNRDRQDSITCQNKAGVSAATGSQVTPTVDAGWVAIGYVAIANGVSTITGGMITALAGSQLNGFLQNGAINQAPVGLVTQFKQESGGTQNILSLQNSSGAQVDFISNTGVVFSGIVNTNVLNQNQFGVGNVAGGGNSTYFGAGTNAFSTVGGVAPTVFGIAANGVGSMMAINANGDLGTAKVIAAGGGNIYSTVGTSGAIFQAGSTSASTTALAFGNTVSAAHYTQIGSMSNTIGTSGVTGTVFEIDAVGTNAVFGINLAGNVGISGTAYTNSSSRTLKKDIQPLQVDACEVVRKTTIHSYRMKTDSENDPLLVGPIAEELPYPISTWNHKGYNNTQAISIALACLKRQDARIVALGRPPHAIARAVGADPTVTLWLQIRILYILVTLLIIERIVRTALRFR